MNHVENVEPRRGEKEEKRNFDVRRRIAITVSNRINHRASLVSSPSSFPPCQPRLTRRASLSATRITTRISCKTNGGERSTRALNGVDCNLSNRPLAPTLQSIRIFCPVCELSCVCLLVPTSETHRLCECNFIPTADFPRFRIISRYYTLATIYRLIVRRICVEKISTCDDLI